jgi:large subunit ribosomal protein L1
MAKKKPAAAEEGGEETKAATPPPAEKTAPASGEGKKPKAPKKEPKEKTAPATPAAESPAAPAAPAATAAPSAAPGEPSAKKKGKQPGRPPRRGKKLRNLLKNQLQNILKEGALPLKKAVSVLKSLRKAKFDQTVEVHMWLGVDTTQNDQMVRGSVPLPHGIGKSVRVLVFCQGDNVAKAKEAGADFAGSDELIKQIQGGWLEFDIALATQDMMGQVSRLGRVLGPRGLMPTPKAGTVITAGADIGAAVHEFKAGKVEYRADKGGNVHAGVGKMSFDEEKLVANISAFIEQVQHAKPAGVKGNYVKSITIAATMSPGIPVVM